MTKDQEIEMLKEHLGDAVAWQIRSTQSASWMNCEKRLFDGIRKDPKLKGVYEVRELFAVQPALVCADHE